LNKPKNGCYIGMISKILFPLSLRKPSVFRWRISQLALFVFLIAFFPLFGGQHDFFNKKQEAPISIPPKEESKITASKLSSLVFISVVDDISAKPTDHGVFIQNVDVPDPEMFQKKMQRFVDQPISQDLMNEIIKETILYYREHQIPIMEAIIPAGQDITDGCLYVMILRGRLDNVRAEGGSDELNERVRKCIRTQKDEIIDSVKMQDDLEWLNKDPFRTVDLIYERGEKLSATDVILKIKESVPVSVYAGYENSGYQIAGPARWTAGFNLGHLWRHDHELNGQFRSAAQFEQLWSVAANYIAPLASRDTLVIFGNYIHVHPPLIANFGSSVPPGTESYGKSWQVSGRYNLSLQRWGNLTHTFVFGYDFKRTNNFLVYALIPFYWQTVDISQFLLRYEGQVTDCLGFTALGISMVMSPGGMTAYNHNKYYEIEQPGARSSYLYFMFNGDRKFVFSHCSYLINLLVQVSVRSLLPSEQLLLGGQFTIRGYKENAIIGDRGFLLKNELQSSPWHFFKNDDLHFLAFVDMGYTGSADKNVNKTSSAFLMSVGPGVRYMIKDYVNIRADYGVQLKSLGNLIIGKPGHGRFHAGIFISF
jgi:hemolysin activation/secretion protein